MRNEESVVTEGPLAMLVASEAVVVVQGPGIQRKALHLRFTRDGSIFAQCPYFPIGEGVLTNVSIAPGPKGPFEMDLAEGGRATTNLVKYAHHPDGEAHFSQDGKILTEVRRRSFPLASTIGKLFQFNITAPEQLEPLTEADLKKKKRVYMPFHFPFGLPASLSIGAEWRRKRDLVANFESPDGKAGPVIQTRHRTTGAESTSFLLGQPSPSPLQDHVLVLSCISVPVPQGSRGATLIFLGGLDPHEVTSTQKPVEQSGLLAFLYPVEDHAKLVARVGSIDYSADQG